MTMTLESNADYTFMFPDDDTVCILDKQTSMFIYRKHIDTCKISVTCSLINIPTFNKIYIKDANYYFFDWSDLNNLQRKSGGLRVLRRHFKTIKHDICNMFRSSSYPKMKKPRVHFGFSHKHQTQLVRKYEKLLLESTRNIEPKLNRDVCFKIAQHTLEQHTNVPTASEIRARQILEKTNIVIHGF